MTDLQTELAALLQQIADEKGDGYLDCLSIEDQIAPRLVSAFQQVGTQWFCSARCWQEGGPHDDDCRGEDHYRFVRQ